MYWLASSRIISVTFVTFYIYIYFTFQIRITFVLIEGLEFLRLSNLARQTIVTNGFQVQGDPQHFVYDKFDKLATGTYYWFLGEDFRGDMVPIYASHKFESYCLWICSLVQFRLNTSRIKAVVALIRLHSRV